MGSRRDGGMGVWGTLLVAGAGILLSWAAFEVALAPILRPGRNALDRSLDPTYDVDDEAVKTVEKVANEAKEKEELEDASNRDEEE